MSTRRTQAERSDTTTGKLVAAARNLFGHNGYAATSIAAIATAAGVTKGAAYHHFTDKQALFRAAFIAEQEWMAAELEQVAAAAPDSWTALLTGCRTFLERSLEPRFRRIVVLDGPAVLGWDTVREIESDHTLRVFTSGLALATAEGELSPGDLQIRRHLIFGALCEGGMMLARTEDPATALPLVVAEAGRLLAALRTTATHAEPLPDPCGPAADPLGHERAPGRRPHRS
ncbi:TetR/AcrR family transcriptional regulator [Nocardia otitidiscaviarum]|uniref:TetR/AcrR family transcriptional regulator n=1 Tax=Nocardia otitidiscaviarum TaxID=1823 RepID=UPI001892E751|nr:TetR/AcrR family transcriptional regulator [Nocardia otitidiscaviarum]MBF6239028.1 TetR/AcrR family transcriptional regulator [Nocardia otitidiscaviarum]